MPSGPYTPLGAPAGAFEAAVGRAGAAAPLELLPERGACAVEADAGVVGGDTEILCDLTDRAVAEVDLVEDLRVLGMERGEQPPEAGAYLVAKLGLRDLRRSFRLERLDPPRLDGPVPVVVGDGVLEDGEEPVHRAPRIVIVTATGDPRHRDKLLTSLRTIGKLPFGFYTGGLSYDLATGAYSGSGKPTGVLA